MIDHFHYTACGLDYIYLENGFKRHETSHGVGYAIHNARELHEAIARHIVVRPSRLRGQEVRFLRAQLRLSQEALASALQTKRVSVARWEGAPNKSIPGTADTALRAFYVLSREEQSAARRLLDLLHEFDEVKADLADLQEAHFVDTESGWEPSQVAA